MGFDLHWRRYAAPTPQPSASAAWTPQRSVGQQVIGAASDKRAVQTFKDAEAILHECLRLQKHLKEQDQVLATLVGADRPKSQ